jgi:hypothetical protein
MEPRRCARPTKMVSCVICLCCFLLAPITSRAQDPCTSYQQCDEIGNKSLKQRKFNEAEVYFALQAKYSEIADDVQRHDGTDAGKPASSALAVAAYNNMTRAYMKTYEYQRARFWCRLALSRDKDDKTAQQNLVAIERKLKRWKWPASLKGTYLRYAGHGEWYIVAVHQERSGKIAFGFSASWIAVDRLGTSMNTGFVGELMPSNRSVTYHGKEGFSCTVRMDFSSDKLVLIQDGNCGLAPGIEVSGTFERVDTSNTGPYVSVEVCEAFAGMRSVG